MLHSGSTEAHKVVCQFLIGTVLTQESTPETTVVAVVCQFLIGTVLTSPTILALLGHWKCQFLIGTVLTKN